jgi:hypothetical protein
MVVHTNRPSLMCGWLQEFDCPETTRFRQTNDPG